MKNIVPDIMRKRLLVEAKYSIEISEQVVKDFLTMLPKVLDLRVYSDPSFILQADKARRRIKAMMDLFP